MAEIYNFEEKRNYGAVKDLFVLVKAIFERVLALCDAIDADSVYFLSDEIEELADVAFKLLNLEFTEKRRVALLQYLEGDIDLPDFFHLIFKLEGK
jgi:hypothetical protein